MQIKFQSTLSRTLRYKLRSREIYIEEPTTSLEKLSEYPQTQPIQAGPLGNTLHALYKYLRIC